MTDNLKHLLGGYATGTLTPEENAALMEAALDDQELFDALADDEALRRYLADPAFRKNLLKATAPRPARIPWVVGLVVAAASVSIGIFWVTHRETTPPITQMAVVRPPTVELPPVPTPALKSTPVPKPTVAISPRRQPEQSVAKTDVEPKKKEPESAKPSPPPPPVIANGELSTDGIVAIGGAVGSVPPAASPVPKAPPAGAAAAFAPRSIVRTEALARGTLLAPRIVLGKVTDVNATIITVNVGSKVGMKVGDRLDILRDNTRIGYVTITDAELEYAVGKYTGENIPAIGDTATTPKK